MQNSFRDRRKQKNIYSRKRRRIEMFYDAEKIVEFSVGRDYKKKQKKKQQKPQKPALTAIYCLLLGVLKSFISICAL